MGGGGGGGVGVGVGVAWAVAGGGKGGGGVDRVALAARGEGEAGGHARGLGGAAVLIYKYKQTSPETINPPRSCIRRSIIRAWETRKWLMLKSSASCSMGKSFSTEPSYHFSDDSGRSDPSAYWDLWGWIWGGGGDGCGWVWVRMC